MKVEKDMRVKKLEMKEKEEMKEVIDVKEVGKKKKYPKKRTCPDPYCSQKKPIHLYQHLNKVHGLRGEELKYWMQKNK